MKIKLKIFNKAICFSLLVLCLLFASCEEPGDPDGGGDDPYNNPNADTSRDLVFSHNSGLHAQGFSLSITAAPQSTVYYSTDGSIPSPEKVDNKFVFQYSAPISVQNRNGQENVLATNANTEQFYMVHDDPRGNVPQVYQPTKDQVPKATVIRAIAVDASGKKSGVATKTYFIGDNLAGYSNHRIISLVSDPHNLVDQDYGIMVRGNPNNRWDGPNKYNFQQKGEAWERPAYLELFEGSAGSRSVPLSTGVGIRVRGAYSRAPGQKSFTVYFKEQYGINNLRNYNLIPGAVKADGSPVDRYKGFMLRSGANDSEYTKFYDVFLQELLNDRSFSTQAGVPCIVYLNGEYWGPYNLQERYSDNHTEYKYGVAKENVISYDNGELDDGNPGEETLWTSLADGVIAGTISYSQFCENFDIDNFIDYWAAQIYIYNEDWPHNNYRLWRTRTPVAGNTYGDTKWRYQMFDTEFAMGIYSSGSTTGQSGENAFEEILNGSDKDYRNNKLFKALLANEDFSRKFVNTIMDLYNTNFHPDKYTSILNRYADTYRPLMGDTNTPGTYFSRWGRPWDTVYQNKVDDARNYLNNIRNAMVYNYLPTYFSGSYPGIYSGISIGAPYDVTLYTTGYNAPIKVNTITVASGWTGKYFSGNPIAITASPDPSGYEFDGWTITGGTLANSSSPTTTVTTISGTANITAKYKQIGVPIVNPTGVAINPATLNLKVGQTANLTATVSPTNTTYKAVSWTSSDNTVATVDGNGKVTAVYMGKGTATATITAKTIINNSISSSCTVTVQGVTEFLNLAERLAMTTTSVGIINSWSTWNSAFGASHASGAIPISPAGTLEAYTEDGVNHPVEVTFEIVNDVVKGVKKLQVNDFLDWASGLNVMSRPSTPLQAFDRIEIKGTFLNGPNNSNSGGLLANTARGYRDENGNEQWWRPLGGWNPSFSAQNTDFHVIFTISAEDAAIMNSNPDWAGAFVLRMNGLNNNDSGSVVPGGIGSFSIEQIRIYRLP